MTATRVTFAAASLVLALASLRAGSVDATSGLTVPRPDATTAAVGATRAPDEPPQRRAAAGPDAQLRSAGSPTSERPPSVPTTPTADGFLVVDGSSDLIGDEGPVSTFTVEIEPATGEDPAAVLAAVESVLFETGRGWVATGRHRLQRVDEPTGADIRVVLATPATVDRFCGRVGLRTNGIFSCWDGRRALLNHDRWVHGARAYGGDVAGYRAYLISHEVGHGLGHGHVRCPAAGAPAPAMMQQTKTVGRCTPNPWPAP